ncbi:MULTISPECIES: MarR family winged helix-turn-helix transcriptional regulator [unclassified Meiothermus]|uniref:MarR family winged helix-turn-helix transcriptional regulator n=1 Tax=unclassified Meiothermus TaxID=370471 RepID=UPI001314C74B|nr:MULTISPECIES: MarR family transcriptional regulator [unclassified Meiothermus]
MNDTSLLELASAILRLSRQIRAALDGPLEATLQLNFSEINVLRLIDQGVHSPSDLARELQIPAPTISRILNHLVERGLVERDVDNLNLRRFHLRLTPEGQRIRQKTRQTAQQILTQRYRQIPQPVLERALEGLQALEPYLREAQYV